MPTTQNLLKREGANVLANLAFTQRCFFLPTSARTPTCALGVRTPFMHHLCGSLSHMGQVKTCNRGTLANQEVRRAGVKCEARATPGETRNKAP